jgi:hypothetical protein
MPQALATQLTSESTGLFSMFESYLRLPANDCESIDRKQQPECWVIDALETELTTQQKIIKDLEKELREKSL